MPTRPLDAARSAATPWPWARSRWWAAALAAASSVRPGAWTPLPYPSQAATAGSFTVSQRGTRSPRAVATISA